MPMSKAHGAAGVVELMEGKPPRRARRDKSDWLTLIQSMKDGQWFALPKGSVSDAVRANVAPWNANGKIRAKAYTSESGDMVVLAGSELPAPTPFSYPEIKDGEPPRPRRYKTRKDGSVTARSSKYTTSYELVLALKPGQWFKSRLKSNSIQPIVGRIKKKTGLRLHCYTCDTGEIVVMREPESDVPAIDENERR